MKLNFQEQQFEFDKTSSLDEVIAKINELLNENYYFSHFIADGNEVYEDHEDFLTMNLDRIEKLEVIAKTGKEFLNELLLSTEDYLQRAKPELSIISEGVYSNPTAEVRTSFGQLMEGLQWLDGMLAVIDNSNERPAEWDRCMELSESMKAEIVSLSEAVENSDNVLIADIIQYEFIPIFESVEIEIGKIIDTVGTRHNLS
ncbi:hypothetical protein [Sporosarcina sp. FSL K6-5500]|uniref:hypothetical protein n=1 Tax=Sporosarcina sp. FSL K6-5500 TaxID=2921558 RepID=UPI0030F9EA34